MLEGLTLYFHYLVRLISCSTLQNKSVFLKSCWHHTHHAITVRLFLPVHQSPSTDDSYMTAYSRSGPRSANISCFHVIIVGFQYKVSTSSMGCIMFCFFLQSDVVHVHVNSIQPLPLCLHHRFVVRKFYNMRYTQSCILLHCQLTHAPSF